MVKQKQTSKQKLKEVRQWYLIWLWQCCGLNGFKVTFFRLSCVDYEVAKRCVMSSSWPHSIACSGSEQARQWSACSTHWLCHNNNQPSKKDWGLYLASLVHTVTEMVGVSWQEIFFKCDICAHIIEAVFRRLFLVKSGINSHNPRREKEFGILNHRVLFNLSFFFKCNLILIKHLIKNGKIFPCDKNELSMTYYIVCHLVVK